MSSDPSNPNLTDGAATISPDEPADEFNDVKAENLNTGDAFETDQAKIGLTSSIDEFVHVGAEQFSEVYEEPLGDKYVLQVKCNINKLLDLAGVRAPENEGVVGDADSKINMSTVGMFEYLLKSAAVRGLDTSVDGAYETPWSGLKSVAATPKELDAQTRLFLGQFFDANKELNALAAESSNSDPRALVLLDIAKIRVELSNLKNDAEQKATIEPGEGVLATYGNADNAYAPVNRKCFATNLLSVRQIAQVLESFAQFGAYKQNSRVKAFANVVDPNDETKNEYYFKYKLHAGDSIIGETTVYDADAADDSEQHSQCIKVQLIQSDEGAWVSTDSDQPATFVDPTSSIPANP